MGKHSVAAAVEGMGVAVAVPSSTSLFPYPLPIAGAGSSGSRRYAREKLFAIPELDVGAAARINSWVDSMRACSPTHAGSPADPHAAAVSAAWLRRHPSALHMFDEITASAKGKQVVVFLDYDGTLSPIVDDPDKAFISDAMKSAVRELASCFPTAIVSGRCLAKVYSFLGLPELYYAGSHGMDIKCPGGTMVKEAPFQHMNEFLPMINKVYRSLAEETKSIRGAKVEHNKFCLSVHFRCVDEKKLSRLAEQVCSVVSKYPKLRLTQGRKVLEIRPAIKWDKGKALLFLLESLGYANRSDILPVYIGDDRTDEDAFKVLKLRRQGLGIIVSKFPKETKASYSLEDPSEVKEFLERLVQWKMSLKSHP